MTELSILTLSYTLLSIILVPDNISQFSPISVFPCKVTLG